MDPLWKRGSGGPGRSREQFFSTTSEIGEQLAASHSDSVVALDSGATVNLVCLKWLGNRNLFSQKLGLPVVAPYSTTTRFKFGDGRVGEVQHAADITAGIAGREGASAMFALGADTPAPLRRGALEALGGQPDFERDMLTIRKHGVRDPLRVNEMDVAP